MAVNAMRHQSVFDPVAFHPRRVDIIGCGATGSRLALTLAKLGITNIHGWDFDKVEGHNIANQAFGNEDIGKFKVEALKDMIARQTGTVMTAHNCAYEGQEALGSVVFLLTDTMKSRKEIWESSIRYHPMINLMIETRMGVDLARVFAINPMDPDQVKFWEGFLYGDETAQVSACGTQISVGPTAEMLSGVAAWTLIQWFASVTGKGEAPDWDVVLTTRPFAVVTSTPAATH